MRLECTKKLLDYLGVKTEKLSDPVDPLFAWTANLIVVNRHKVLVGVHQASRCVFLLYGLTAKMRPNLSELLLDGVRSLLRSEYVRPEIIEKYLDECGRTVTFYGNSSRSAVGSCNKACERVKVYSDLLETGNLYQEICLPILNEDMVAKEDYSYSHELLLNGLRQRYGEDIQSCQAAELEVALQDTDCKRILLVPDNLNFYQLHRILQEAFEWRDCHLHQFVLEKDRYGMPFKTIALEDEDGFPDPDVAESLNSLSISIGEVFRKYKTIDYEYDFGDGWIHTIKCRRFISDCSKPYPHCIQAIGDAPIENCGGPYTFMRIKAILNDPDHPEHKAASEWLQGCWWHPLDVERINRWLRYAYRLAFPFYYR